MYIYFLGGGAEAVYFGHFAGLSVPRVFNFIAVGRERYLRVGRRTF